MFIVYIVRAERCPQHCSLNLYCHAYAQLISVVAIKKITLDHCRIKLATLPYDIHMFEKT